MAGCLRLTVYPRGNDEIYDDVFDSDARRVGTVRVCALASVYVSTLGVCVCVCVCDATRTTFVRLTL